MGVRVEQTEGFEWGRWFRALAVGALVMIVGGVLIHACSTRDRSDQTTASKPAEFSNQYRSVDESGASG